ncbi:MAG: phosphoribosylanthranilate isomerase [Gemmatimonadota bacterium]
MVVDAKICGLTRPEDAALAAEHGAWRLGVIFADGPRLIDAARARAIVSASRGVPVVGVFRVQSVSDILKMVGATGIRGAQLHGDYSRHDADAVRATGVEVWRVVTIDDETDLSHELASGALGADALLVEPRLPGASGGRGVALDGALAERARRAAPAPVRFVLAGGLRPENVAEQIRLVGPDVVDVSSGVEFAPGRKDPERLIRFLEIVRDARASR